jgi:transaldolase
MNSLAKLSVKLFADGADRADMLALYRNPLIKGFTTNPTLMRKAGVVDYETFARQLMVDIPDKPLSFEVFSDDFEEMKEQARRIASWGENVYVKIPVTNTRGESSAPLVRELARTGVKMNVTAVFTLRQVNEVCQALRGQAPAIVSVFAGRIADAGVDPVPIMAAARELVRMHSNLELLWASPREVWNIFQADAAGCDIITVAKDLVKKLDVVGKDLNEFSLETVQMFRNDALGAGLDLGNNGGHVRRAA